ncbi:MAG: Fic family protein [Thermoplasmata archaeon]|nr:Fic family protein [Thermoplasmata archaeon]
MKQIILEALRSALLERTGFEDLPEKVWKRSGALNTWGTNAIEGSTITRKEAERLILEGKSVARKPVMEVLETLQHERVFRDLVVCRHTDTTLNTVLEFHEGIFRGILLDAGQWRRVNVRIEGASFTPPRMEKVVREMERWERAYRDRDVEGNDVFTLGAWLHFEFERIHPFSDGNGRVGRLLLNLHFLRRNWPPIHILPSHREQYMRALAAAAKDNLAPLTEFLKILMGASLVDLLDQVGTAEDELLSLSEAAKEAPYSPQYLALRCKQGELPAVKSGREWRTSKHALRLYLSHLGRKAL